MFGFQNWEPAAVIARKKIYLAEAQRRWPFLTRSDFSTIHCEAQLAAMMKDRTAMTREEADTCVHRWTRGKQF